jgi:hypothetical protein
MTINNISHSFSVTIPARTPQVAQQDLDKLSESLEVEREEPEQLRVAPISRGASEEMPTEQQRIEDAISDLREWMVAAAEMQKVLGEKLKSRTVTVDPKVNPSVRDAIARLFGTESNTITYDMYKQALEWRSELLKEGRDKTYGTGS